jgi:Cdc6-like AAA superfamily ATPase
VRNLFTRPYGISYAHNLFTRPYGISYAHNLTFQKKLCVQLIVREKNIRTSYSSISCVYKVYANQT